MFESRRRFKQPDADVVVAIEYRKYERFRSRSDQNYVEGIKFYEQPGGRTIINYPKQYIENGATKNSNTNQNYKPSVRMFKNVRSYLVENGHIGEDVAPSYFVECMLYNVPNQKFTGDWQEIYTEVVRWLSEEAPLSDFICQNEQHELFGNTPEQWTTGNAGTLIQRYVDLWNEW